MAEVKYKPVVYKTRQNADGTYSVKIRVTFKRKSAYLTTTEYATKDQLSKNLEIVDYELLSKLYTLILKIKKIESKIDPFVLQTMEVSEVATFIKKVMLSSVENFRLPFVAYAQKFIAAKNPGSARNYQKALKSFCAFVGQDEFDIAIITSSMMRRYEEHLRAKYGNDSRALSLYTMSIGSIHKAARLEYNDNELGEVRIKNPFDYYSPPRQKWAKHRALSVETIQKLIDIRHTASPRQRQFIELCLLSFCLMGANAPDIYEAKREGNVICYNRAKTRDRRDDDAEMRIRLEPECECIWGKFLDPSNKRAFNFYQRYKTIDSVVKLAYEGDERARIMKEIGADQLTMYSFRHSWATIAYSIGIDRGLIDDCLCHSSAIVHSNGTYVAKTWSMLWEANKKVLAQFTWK